MPGSVGKTQIDTTAKTAPMSAVEQQAKPPEQESIAGRQASVQRVAPSALPPPAGGMPPHARAAEMLATPGAGAAGRARMMGGMQRQVGNARVGRMVEASAPMIQRTCACGGQAGSDGECEACKAKRMAVQRQASANGTPDALPPSVTTALQSSGGQPLDHSTRAQMEPAFGTDFGDVRVHTGAQPDRAARDINAKAFTTGQDIFFAAGQHQPGTQDGDKLLAHELTHTVQQGNGSGAPQAAGAISQPGEPQEQEAEEVAQQVSTGGAIARAASSSSSSSLQGHTSPQRSQSPNFGTIYRDGAPLPPTSAADSAATLIAQAVRDGDIGGAVRPLRGRSIGEVTSIRALVNAQANVQLERWLVARMNRASAVKTGLKVLGTVGGLMSPVAGLVGAGAALLGPRLASSAATDGTAEEGLRLLWPTLPLLDRLEIYNEGYRELEQAQLDVIRAASAEQRAEARSETERLNMIYANLSVKEEYDARLLIDPKNKYVAATRVLERAPGGLLPDEEDLVFDAIWALTPTERSTFYNNNTGPLDNLLLEDRFKLLGTLVVGTEAQALIARLRLATEGRIDDQEAVRAVVDRAVALLADQKKLRATLADVSLPPKELSDAQARLVELGELESLLKFGTGKLDPKSFLGRLADAADSPDAFGAMAQKLGGTITDPAQQAEFAFRTAKQRVLMAAGLTGANEDSVRNAILELRAPPITDAGKLTPAERDQKQAEANAKLRQQLIDDKEVKDVINTMPTSAGMRVRSFVNADPFIERLTALTLALNAARWGEFFQIVLQIAMRDDWKARFEDTAKSPFDTFARVHGEQRKIMLDILKDKRIPTNKILGFTGNVEVLRTALANMDEGERGQLRVGYLLTKSGRKPAGDTEGNALAAYKTFDANLRKSQTTLGTVDTAGIEAVLDAALGAEPTAKEMETDAGRYNAAALMYERQQARLALGRGASAYFTETDETMVAAGREFAALWLQLRERTPHTLSTVELGKLAVLHDRFTSRTEEFTEASNTAGEVAGMIAATVAGILVVVGTGGLTAPAVIAAAAAGGTARVVTREMFGEAYYNPVGGEGGRDVLLGGIDAALAVLGASLGAKGAELLGLGGKAFLINAARIGGEVAEQASRKLSYRVAAGAVEGAIEGAFSGFISEAISAMTDARTWRRGIWQGLLRVGEAALVAGLTGLVGGAAIGGALPVLGRGASWALERAAAMRIESALVQAGAGETLSAAQRAARAGDVEALDKLIGKLEARLSGDEVALLRKRLYADVEASFGHPPGRADIATPEQARLLAQTSPIEDGNVLSAAQREAEIDIVRRSEPQPGTLDAYVDEVDLGNRHTWRRRADGTWCRFTAPSLCGTKISGAPAPRTVVRVTSQPPPSYRVVKMDYVSLPRDAAGNITPLPEGVVYEFPGGHRVWREGEAIRHESVLGYGSKKRKGTELEMFLASETGIPAPAGMERAHTLGHGTGFESPFGIFYAPKEVNQIIQNNGVEELFRGFREEALAGEAFHVATLTTPHPGTLRLREVRYRVEVSRNGRRDFLFEYVINVGNDVPNPKVTHEVANITENPDIAHYFDLVDVPERLRDRFAKYAKKSGGG